MQRDPVDLEQEREPGVQPRLDQVLDDLRLPVDRSTRPPVSSSIGDRGAARPSKRSSMPSWTMPSRSSRSPDARARAGGRRVPCSSTPGADPLLDVLAAAALEHDRLDARPSSRCARVEARRTRADDPDLRPHRRPSSRAAFSLRISGRTSGLISSLLEVGEPAVGRDQRVVGAEEDAVARAACSRSARAAAGSTSATSPRGRCRPAACAARPRSPRPATGTTDARARSACRGSRRRRRRRTSGSST